MRPIADLVGRLREARVRIWDDGDALRYQAPEGALTQDLLNELRSRKVDLLAFCRHSRRATEATPLTMAREATPSVSLAQQRLWVVDQLRGPDPAYNIPLPLRLKGPLSVRALQSSLEAILGRHEVLRTSFHAADHGVTLTVVADCPLPWQEVDLSGLPAGERLPEARRQMREQASRPFDLGEAPLIRFRLWRLDADDHIFMGVVHHIVADGRSIEILSEDLAALYEAACQGRVAALPALDLRYSDFAFHQRSRLDEAGAQRAYWREALADMPPVLDVPADHPRPAVFSSAGATVHCRLQGDVLTALRGLARQWGYTPYVTMLAAVGALLARYTGRDDIPIACPATHRDRPELERLIGFFVDTLVLRLDLSGNPAFGEILRRARNTAAEAFANQVVPFDAVVEGLGVERSPSYTPLAQVSVAMLNAQRAKLHLFGLDTKPVDFDSPVARYDLALEIHESTDALDLYWLFSTGLFDAPTVQRMGRHLLIILEAVVADPGLRLVDIPLADRDELERVTAAWNDTEVAVPPNAFAHKLFEARARDCPDAVALECRGRHLTYRELNARSNQIAHRLNAAGIGPDQPVGIRLGRSLEMVACVLAVLKAGGAYLPLDPALPAERLGFMIGDSGCRLLIGYRRDGAVPCPALWLDEDDAVSPDARGDDPDVAVAADDLAYVIYTSGSTGRPKGCQIEHRGLVNYLNWAGSYYYAGADGGSFGLFTSLGFDLTVTSLFLPLIRGRTLRIFPDDMPVDAVLRACFEPAAALDSIKLTPSHIALLPSLDLQGTKVGTAVVGGEQLLPHHVAILRQLNPAMRIFNEYGPTEATVGCAVKEILAGDDRILIGRPIDNTRLYVLDPHGRPQPIGVPGELHIGGSGLARGYLGRPDLTAERFIPDPVSPMPGARLYRSGDLARWRPTGDLECLGRTDRQVKIRGFRVEPDEIEAILGDHPAVRQAAVLVRQGDDGSRRLVAYVAGTGPIDGPELRRFLGGRLPDYMVPTAFFVAEALPLTVNGKVDRAALRNLRGAAAGEADPFAPPRTEVERVLAGIWADLLRMDEVGIHSNFFALGGDSILGIRAIGRAIQAGLPLRPTDLLHNPTVAELAAATQARDRVAPSHEPASGPAPLTPIQHWFFAQDLPEPHHCNQALLLTLHEPMRADLLNRCVRDLVHHHDALRTRFRFADGGWRPEVEPSDEAAPVRWIDLSGIDAAERGAAIEAGAAALQTRLDLGRNLMEMAYFDCGPHEAPRLLWIIHHLVVDAASWRILLEDLFAAYRQRLEDVGSVRLPPSTTSVGEWARRLAGYAGSAGLQRERAFWLSEEAQQPLRLPVDRLDGPDDERSTRLVAVTLAADETGRLLRHAATAQGPRIADALLFALGEALAAWVGPGTLPIDLEGHGRDSVLEGVDLGRTVGWLTTLTPIMLPLRREADRPNLRRIQDLVASIPRDGHGYGVLRYLGRDGSVADRLRRRPRREVCLSYTGRFDRGTDDALPFTVVAEASGPWVGPRNGRAHLIRVDGQIEAGCLQIRWRYSANRHDPRTIETLAETFVEALRRLPASNSLDEPTSPELVLPNARVSQQELSKVARLIEKARKL